MKALVAVKQVIDANVKIRVNAEKAMVETQNVKMSMNPFDEIAVEEGLRLREQDLIKELVVVSVGNQSAQETLLHALALGADRAIWIKTDQTFCSLNIAKIVQKIVLQENPDLVLMGKQSIDADNNQTPQMLAALLDWSQATFASNVNLVGDKLEVIREIDGGLETLSMPLPAVISTDLRLNEPRYASLPNIMKAKRKPLDCIELATLNLDLPQHKQILGVRAPAKRVGGAMVDSIASLIDKLKHEAKVL